MKILVVEDDTLLMEFISRCLENSGFEVVQATEGVDGYKKARRKEYEGIVLDIKLPGMTGTEICQKIREEGVMTPVIFLSSLDSKDDRVRGLELGADDYLVKPFSHDELIARVKALVRRPVNYVSNRIEYSDLIIDTATRQILIGEKEVKLTPKEFQLLEIMARNPDTVLSREYLLNHIWGVTVGNTSNRLEVCIRNLRKKLGKVMPHDFISTEYGVGYKLSID